MSASEVAVGVQADRLVFPPGFWWGAATAAYQIEGSVAADGRTPSIWDTFCATPGKVVNGESGAVAADHYRRYAEDVELISKLGLSAYRFSVSWPRVQPGGAGRENPAGAAFYDRLVDRLLEHGIRPVVTLYHWDLPQELEDLGGWTNRDTAYRFADYAALVAARLGDRVELWTTLNEPWCSAFLGYGSGGHAPGRTNPAHALAAAHHLLLAHGLGVRAIRAQLPRALTSLVLNLSVTRSVSSDPADRDATRRVDGLMNRLFLDPVLRGRYPVDVQADTAGSTGWDFVQDGDVEVIAAPIDALGVNYYAPMLTGAAHPPAGPGAPTAWPGCEGVAFHKAPGSVTDMDWPVDPTGLLDVLVRLRREYGEVPLFVTENGAAYPDRPTPDGRIPDLDRIAYLHAHLAAAHQAISEGVDLRGYFVWSLLDNFEWAEGYGKRFGLVHIDYETQRRTWKDSAHWYRDVITSGGIPAQWPAG